MALTESQKSTIQASIAHFLYFPEDMFEFMQKESELMEALTSSVNKDHEFYWLGECLKNPTQYFQTLEQQGPAVTSVDGAKHQPITIGEVQTALLEHISEALSKTGKNLFSWNQQEILDGLPATNWTTEFKSKKAPVEAGDSPWQLPALPNKIYTQELRIVEELQEPLYDEFNDYDDFDAGLLFQNIQVAYLDITVTGISKNPLSKTVKLKEFPRRGFRNDADENKFIEDLLKQAGSQARSSAARIVMGYLISKYGIDSKHVAKAQNAVGPKEVLTHRYWFDLINCGSLKFSSIYDLDDDEAKNLIHPTVITLYQQKKLGFTAAKNLTAAELLVISHPVYYALIQNNTINIDGLKGISSRRARLLIHPHMTNLIQMEKISFEQAMKLPYDLKNILLSSVYVAFFRNNTIDWGVFDKIKKDQSQLLLKNTIVRLLCNGVIKLEEVVALMEQNVNSDDTFFQLITTAFANRLTALCYQTPFLINSTIDTINIVTSELTPTLTECHTESNIAKEWIFYKILFHLQSKMNEKKSELDEGDQTIDIYNNMQKKINIDDSNSETPWAIAFSGLISLAIEVRDSIRIQEFTSTSEAQHSPTLLTSNVSIFSQKSNKRKERPSDEDIKYFCDGIISLAPIITDKQELRNSYSFGK